MQTFLLQPIYTVFFHLDHIKGITVEFRFAESYSCISASNIKMFHITQPSLLSLPQSAGSVTLFICNYIKPLLLLPMLGRIYSHADDTKSSSCFVSGTAHFVLAPHSHSTLFSYLCVSLFPFIAKRRRRLNPDVDGTEMLIDYMVCNQPLPAHVCLLYRWRVINISLRT